MRAVRFCGPGDLRVEDVPEPVAGLDDVLVRPLSVGVCGTDVHILDGTYPARAQVTLGHEVAGQVVATGSAVSSVSAGDLVTIQPNLPCDTCRQCRLGMEHMCDNRSALGVELDGGMADLMVVPARAAYPVPAGIPAPIAALAEPLACCVHGMDRLAPRSGLPLLVCGCGPVGAMLIGLARLSGLSPIVAADPRPDRRDLALRFGADLALDPADPGFEGRARAATPEVAFAYAIDAVGSAAVVQTCLRLAGRGGRVLVFGVAAPDAEARVRPYEVYAKELTIIGAAVNPYTQARAVGLLHRLPLPHLRIATYPLAEAAAAIEAVRRGGADKVQLVPDEP